MSQASLSVRIDSDIKKQFDNFCEEVGMNTSVAINLFIKAVLREKRIPFEIATEKEDSFYSVENQKRINAAINRIEAGRGV